MIKNLVVFTGSESFRLNQKVKLFKKAFAQKYPDGEIVTFDETTSFSDLENTSLTPNLFGGKRLIFTENFWNPEKFEKAEKKDFFKNLPDFEDYCTIIIIEPNLDKRTKFAKFLAKNAKVENFNPLADFALTEWIIKETQKINGSISQRDAQYLTSRCGDNLYNLSQEILKLTTYSEKNIITKESIDELTLPHPKVIIWDFLSCLSQKRTKQAILLFRQLIQMGEAPHMIFAMIIREIRIHTQICAGIAQRKSSKEIASLTKLHPFVVQKTMPLSRKFTIKQLKKAYISLLNIDQRLKTGGIVTSTNDQSEFELAIEKFIVQTTH